MIKKLILFIFLAAAMLSAFPQSNNATLRGVVRDSDGKPLDMVNIGLKDYPLGTSSNREGKFLLRIPAGKKIVVAFSSLGYAAYSDTVYAGSEENVYREIVLQGN